MRYKVEQNILARALNIVSRSIANRATLPALSGVLIEAKQQELVLAGSNLETAIRVVIRAEVEEEGIFLVPAKLLLEYVNSLPKQKIECECTEARMNIRSGKQQSYLAGMSYEDYPELGFDGHSTPYRLPIKDLAEAIEHVAYAASPDDARAILTGINLSLKKGAFELAATDGFRLAVEKLVIDANDEFAVVIPAKVMLELARLVRESSGEYAGNNLDYVMCGKTGEGTQMLFVLPNGVQMLSRLLEGSFPAYQKIIPTNYATKVTFETESLLAEVKRAALFSAQSSNMLYIDVESDGRVIFGSKNMQVGEYRGELNAVVEGSENKIAFNGRYLIDYLSKVKGKEVILEMNRGDSPGMWRMIGMDEYIYVVMPMNRE